MRIPDRVLTEMDSPIGAHAHLLDQIPDDRPLIDMSQGAPGYPPSPEIAARVAQIADDPDGGRYTPQLGLPSLRSAFADELVRVYGAEVSAADVGITAGCNQAFCLVTAALTEPGDGVMLHLPYYFNHDMWLVLTGLRAQYLDPSDGVIPSVGDAAEVITEATRAIVLISPGNPTGQVLPSRVFDEFADLAEQRDLVLIVDETYRSFVPGGDAPHRLFDRPNWREHVVSLHSFSKDLAIPGYRVGALVGHPDLLRQVAKLIDCVAICAPRIGQEAAVAGLTESVAWRTQKIEEIAVKQRRFEAVLGSRPGGFELWSAGAYYAWVRHPVADAPSALIAERLLLEQGVLTIPGSAFVPGDTPMLRFSFANATFDQIDTVGNRLRAFGEAAVLG